jgi:hypothetical protein
MIGGVSGQPDRRLADVEKLHVVGVEIPDQGGELLDAQVEGSHLILACPGGQALQRTGDDAVSCLPNIDHEDITDLQIDPHTHGGLGNRRVANPRATPEPAADLDQSLGLQDPECLARHSLGDAEVVHQLPLDREWLAGSELAFGNACSDVRRDGEGRFQRGWA